MEKYRKVRGWVEDLPKMGRISFSQEDAMGQFPGMAVENIRNSLYRLVKNGTIQSVWHGFFVIVPAEYGLRGIVPPIEYIDQLMRYLNREYYVALLSAAAVQGASHQQPQEFTVAVDTGNLRSKLKGDVKINFVSKKNIPSHYIRPLAVSSGYVNISVPELTAMDLLLYVKNIGGLNRAVTVLNELAEILDFERMEKDFYRCFSSALIQRLGYLLENILGHAALAEKLYRGAAEAGVKFRNYPLMVVPGKTSWAKYPINRRWKISINAELEAEE
jgi:predicted transcriptional regulator of viral defense system